MNIQFINQWTQFKNFKVLNWITFNPIFFEVDYDKSIGVHISITFILMGFGFSINWVNAELEDELENVINKLSTKQ